MHEDLFRDSRRLPQFGAMRLSGPDTRTFLQGQLSADVLTLTPETVLLASCNSAQGRVQAVLWVLERGNDIVLITSAELIEGTAARLKKYVLRAKVKFEPETLHVYGLASATSALPATGDECMDARGRATQGAVAEGQGEGAAAWTAPLAQTQQPNMNLVSWPGSRTLLIALRNDTAVDGAFVREWQLADIRCGVPTVHTQTHESFVAQMLNLDLLGGISFEKGCYTGQEIIARTHYRGTVKRRMLRYRFSGATPAPGTRIVAGDEMAGEVVTAAADELLAVIQLAHLGDVLRVEGAQAPLQPLTLPYPVPTEP